MPEQGITENNSFTNPGPKNEIGVAAEFQILSVSGVTDADLALLLMGKDYRVVRQPLPTFLCAFLGKLY